MNHDEIAMARRAYELWQARGCPVGSPEVDWHEAARQLASAPASASARTSVTASDNEQATEGVSSGPTHRRAIRVSAMLLGVVASLATSIWALRREWIH